jgi:hypothetical protein
MLSAAHEELIKALYRKYSEEFKPWLAAVESKYQEFPATLLNEIRAYVDHISRCYVNGSPDAQIEKNIDRASGHLDRGIYDCIKYLVVWYFEDTNKFEAQTKNVDLTIIENGAFYVNYRSLRKEAESLVRKAKVIEKINHDESYRLFQDGFNTYCQLSEMIYANLPNINWARKRGNKLRVRTIILWILSVVFSGVISFLVGQYLSKQSLSTASSPGSSSKSTVVDQLKSQPGPTPTSPAHK